MESEKIKRHFREICPEDVEDCQTVLSNASKVLNKDFHIKLKDDVIIFGCIFEQTYQQILQHLIKQEKDKDSYFINIADRLIIGFDNSNNENDEKQGNFSPYIRHLNSDKKDEYTVERTDGAKEISAQWMAKNIVESSNDIKEIRGKVKEALEDIDIQIASSEIIFPIFIKIYEELASYIQVKRNDLDAYEYEINFLSCFTIGCREIVVTPDDKEKDEKKKEKKDKGENTEEDEEISVVIYIRPSIQTKLGVKNDQSATAIHE